VTFCFIRLLGLIGLARQIRIPRQALRQAAGEDPQILKLGEIGPT
jgi:hypothetical protein